jgi:8-oxo-dGTP pyrophosphatase MutT (NUDIX family)
MKKVMPGTIGVIFNDKQELLMQLRSDHNLWGLPGGSVEFGESFSQTMIREIEEETGVIVSIVRVIGIYSDPASYIFEYPDGNSVHGFLVGFEGRPVGFVDRDVSGESLDVGWFALDKLPSNILRNHKRILSQICDDRHSFVVD